jgi:RNA polymerase sigma-70 factor (ECF subfamily)
MSAGMNDTLFVQELTNGQRGLYSYILSLVPSPAEADDILQESNLVLLRKASDFEPGSNFFSWACRIAYFEVLTHYRKRRRSQHPLGAEDILEFVAQEACEQIEEFDERLSALRGCLQRLNDRKRQLLKRFYFDGCSMAQIAVERTQSEGVIKVTVHRIRTELLACIHKTIAVTKPT